MTGDLRRMHTAVLRRGRIRADGNRPRDCARRLPDEADRSRLLERGGGQSAGAGRISDINNQQVMRGRGPEEACPHASAIGGRTSLLWLGGGGGFLCCILLSVILAAHLPYNRLYAPVVRRTASIMQGFPYRAES